MVVSKLMLFVIVAIRTLSSNAMITYLTLNIIFLWPLRESFGFLNVLRQNGTMCTWIIYTTTASYAGLNMRKINCCVVWLGHMDNVWWSKLFIRKWRVRKTWQSGRRSKSGGDECWCKMSRYACRYYLWHKSNARYFNCGWKCQVYSHQE